MPNLRQAMMGAAGVSTGPEGSLWSWGYNNNWGSLGDGTTINRSSPVQIGSLTDWATPCGTQGRSNFCVKKDGTLWAWGGGANGQLGLNSTVDYSSPVQVGSLTDWHRVFGGAYFAIAVKTDGTLWSWGDGDGRGSDDPTGQLAQGDKISRSSPTQVGSLTDWNGESSAILEAGYPLKLAGWTYGAGVIKDDGTLWTWGGRYGNSLPSSDAGNYGEAGQSTRTLTSSPVQVGSLTDWKTIHGNSSYSGLAAKTDGTLWAWGTNTSGQLGQGDVVNRSSPTQVGSLTTWKSVGAGYNSSIAVKTDGTLWTWGQNTAGQGGNGDVVQRSSPVQVGSLTDWSVVSSGYEYSKVLKADGTLWIWGTNNFGQLGQGDVVSRSSPVQLGTYTAWGKTSTSSEGYHSEIM